MENLGFIEPIFNALLAGGPTSVIALLFLCVLFVAYSSHYVINMFLRIYKEQLKSREEVIAAKEKELHQAAERIQELLEKYQETTINSVEVARRMESSLNEIKIRLMVAAERGGNQRAPE